VPCRVQVRQRPADGGGLRRDLAGGERVEHATVADDGEGLRPPIPDRVIPGAYLLAPHAHRRVDLALQGVDWNRIDQLGRVRARQRDAALPHLPPHDQLVVVDRRHQPACPVVQVMEGCPGLVLTSEQVLGEVGALQVLRPRAGPIVDAGMQRLEVGQLGVREVVVDHDQPVDIAMLVPVTQAKGALQVGADEVVFQDGTGASDQVQQHSVEAGKRRGGRGHVRSW